MIFRQFATQEGDLSYLFADPVTGEAALVDPNLAALDDYRQAIYELGLTLRYALETHLHESHISAAATLRASTGVQIVMSDYAEANCIDRRLHDGDAIYLGEETITALATPGHSPCSMVYCWRDRVFTGHTLLVGSPGHCHRDDADPAALYDSVANRLLVLPGDTLVFPGRQVDGKRVSTIVQERQVNRSINLFPGRDDFIAAGNKSRGTLDEESIQLLLVNSECRSEIPAVTQH
jgi:sulfur dioxygenase